MRQRLDARVASAQVVEFVRRCQARVHCRLAGGVALSGAFFGHRQSHDVDLFCDSRDSVRLLAQVLADVADSLGARCAIVQDAGPFVRAQVTWSDERLEVDLVFDSTPSLGPPTIVDGVVVESLADLCASKVTCLLSRSEPRDLVDVLFLERAGFTVEAELPNALKKDAGVDPSVLAWLLGSFPVAPLPVMLEPLSVDELKAFRDKLRARLQAVARPASN